MYDFEQKLPAKRNKTIITEDIIDRMPVVQMFESSFSNNSNKNFRLNPDLYGVHRELLFKAMRNDNNEVGIVWNYETGERYAVLGGINGISMQDNKQAANLLSRSDYCSVVFVHNHPMNHGFSMQDIKTFYRNNSVYAMTAVCNDGRIHMLRKEGIISDSYFIY